MTALACVMGWPVAHSLSPAIHNAGFAAAGLDWTFVPLAIRPGAIAEGVHLLGELEVHGASVTMPHKQTVVPFLARLAGDAARLGAVNTIAREGAALVGHNTDGAGFLRALAAETGVDPAGASATVLGAGGAARAVALALADAGVSVTVISRRPEQAADVAALHQAISSGNVPGRSDLVVNATPVRDEVPFDVANFGTVAADLLYGRVPSAFLRGARAAGATAMDGLGMLVHQAALAFTIWTGIEAPVTAMAEGARAARAGGTSDMPGQVS